MCQVPDKCKYILCSNKRSSTHQHINATHHGFPEARANEGGRSSRRMYNSTCMPHCLIASWMGWLSSSLFLMPDVCFWLTCASLSTRHCLPHLTMSMTEAGLGGLAARERSSLRASRHATNQIGATDPTSRAARLELHGLVRVCPPGVAMTMTIDRPPKQPRDAGGLRRTKYNKYRYKHTLLPEFYSTTSTDGSRLDVNE